MGGTKFEQEHRSFLLLRKGFYNGYRFCKMANFTTFKNLVIFRILASFFFSSRFLHGQLFAEISRKFSAVCWFSKTEDCIFPRSFILRFNVKSFNILPSFNLAIVSQSIHNLSRSPFTIFLVVLSQSITFTELLLFIYPFRKYTPLCVYLRFPQSLSCTLQVHCTYFHRD